MAGTRRKHRREGSVKQEPGKVPVKRKRNIHMAFGHKDHKREGKRARSPRGKEARKGTWNRTHTLTPT